MATFDKGFFTKVTDSVREVFSTFVNDPNGILCEPLEYEEVARVCSTLKLGVSGVEIDYEHIRYAGPPLWKLLFQLYQNYFDNFSVFDSLLTSVILPLFKGKGAKANNKDNYRGITLFPTLCKIFEMVLLKRLENFAEQMGLCSNMQFGFKEGVGCTEASFTILESINHMLERGNKVFSCFLDVRKAFDTVWIDGLLFKLFSEFGIRGRMWLVIRGLYTGIKAQVLYSGSLSRKFDVLQGTGQGRILAPFMYKVYINELVNELTQHSCALSLNSISLTSPSFADDITLLSIYRTFLSTFMNMCYEYSIKWRYEFNHLKSGIVTFGETERVHSEAMKVRNWTLGRNRSASCMNIKTLVFLKNYIGSFSTNADENIKKTNFDRHKVSPLIYIIIWREACLSSLLYGTELFTLTSTLLAKLERCQQWFLKNVFYVPKFASRQLLLKLSGLRSIESEIALRKLLLLGCLLTEDKMAPVVRNLFEIRTKAILTPTLYL